MRRCGRCDVERPSCQPEPSGSDVETSQRISLRVYSSSPFSRSSLPPSKEDVAAAEPRTVKKNGLLLTSREIEWKTKKQLLIYYEQNFIDKQYLPFFRGW